MARYAELPNGTRLEFPDETPDAVMDKVVKGHLTKQPEESTLSKIGGVLGNIGAGAVKGASQIGATILAPVDALGLTGMTNEQRRAYVDQFMQDRGADPESMSYGAGKLGSEIAGTAGVGGAIAKGVMGASKIAPVLAPKVAQAIESAGFTTGAPATTVGGKIANAALRTTGGAITGGASAGLIDPNQIGTGAGVGAAVSAALPVVGGAVSKVIQKYNKPVDALDPVVLHNDAIKQVASDLGVAPNQLPQDLVNLVKLETEKAFKQGSVIDPAALLRQQEFKNLGIDPLQGQLTRNPNQYAQEINMRGVSPEISQRLESQNQKLQGIFGTPTEGAKDAYNAGNEISDVLRGYNKTKRSEVSSLYQAARESAGKDLEIPLQGLAQDYATVLDNFGDKVPSGVRNQFKKLGLEGEKQTKLFTVEEADKVMKVINENVGIDPSTNLALGKLRDAVRASVESVDASGGVFAPAVNAAKQRFKELDKIPALKSVAEGNAVPDNFVQNFVIKGKTDDVKQLADLLRKESPEAFGQAKAKMAEDIQRAAFGENLGKDASISPERLAKKLRELGDAKLGSFFSPEEIDRYRTASRVATYIAKHPNLAPVNTSNTLVAQLMTNPALSMVANAKGLGTVMAAGKAVSGAIQNQKAITAATNANVPVTKLDLTESQRKLLAKVMGAMGGSTSAALAQ